MSKKYFVDTNIFVYALFRVDELKYAACIRLFEKAQKGTLTLWTTEWVIAELIWFLGRRGQSHAQIKSYVLTILGSKGIFVQNKQRVLSVIHLWESGDDFLDIYNIFLIQEVEIKRGYSYDKDLDAFTNFTRLEP